MTSTYAYATDRDTIIVDWSGTDGDYEEEFDDPYYAAVTFCELVSGTNPISEGWQYPPVDEDYNFIMIATDSQSGPLDNSVICGIPVWTADASNFDSIAGEFLNQLFD